jgi:hypothetical protein
MRAAVLCLVLVAAALARADVELPVADLEPPANPMLGALDRWGDWLRGGDAWTLRRRLVEDAPQGRFSVVTEPTVKDPAQPRGWYFSGLRVDGQEWTGMTELRFWAKAEMAGPCRVIFHYSGSPWAGKKYIASQEFTLGTDWREYRLPVAEMKRYPDAPGEGDFARTQALSWTIEREPNTLYLDDIRIVLPDAQWHEVQLARSRHRFHVLERDLRILGTVLRTDAGESPRLPEADRLLAAGEWQEAAKALEQLTALRDGMLAVRGLQRRIAHYQDKLVALRAVPESRPLATRLARLSTACDGLRRNARFASADPPALGRELDAFWRDAQPLFAAHSRLLRPMAKGSSWYRPGGRRLVPLAPHSMYTMFTPDSSWRQAREVDYERLSQWGCNGTRLEVKWHLLEPTQGHFDPDYLAMIERVIDWCDKHGLYVCVDLHWPYPDWFYAGPPEAPNANREEQNPYHWPEAVRSAYRRLVPALASHPNILAWEVPTNEPAISSIEIWKRPGNLPTIQDIPALMRSWNEWLLARYGSRDGLDRAWRTAVENPAANGLGAEEDPARQTVLPPGCRGVDKAVNRRIYDYMEWAVQTHTGLCSEIADIIHQTLPDAVTQQQWLAGGARWEHDPIPVNYRPWLQLHAPNVQVGTHYGVGSDSAYISALGCPSTNSEEQATGRQGIYARHRARGQGTCPFTLFPIGHGFCDWHFDLQDSAVWMMAVGEFWESARRTRPAPVLILVNSRTAAIGGGATGLEVRALLEAMDVEYDQAATAYVVSQPDVLRNYRAVFATMSYADPVCLRLLAQAGLPVFLVGTPDRDVRARTDLAKQLVGDGVLLARVPGRWGDAGVPASLDLSGQWRFRTDPGVVGDREHWEKPELPDSDWEEQAVPAYWENTGVLNKGRVYDGVAWYRRSVTVPPSWRGKTVVLEFGAIDDLDRTYVNGVLVGETDEKTPEYWQHHRVYAIPEGVLRSGKANTVAVRVTDLRGDGGIWCPPVRLAVPSLAKARLSTALPLFAKGEELPAETADRTARILRTDLAPETRLLATFAGGEAALAQWHRILWWLGGEQVSLDSDRDQRLVAAFLAGAKVPHAFPLTAESRLLQKHEYDTAFTVVTASRKPVVATLPTRQVLVDLEGYPLNQTFLPDGTSQIPIRTPWASNATFLRKTSLSVRPDGAPVALHEFRVIETEAGTVYWGRTTGGAAQLRLATEHIGPPPVLRMAGSTVPLSRSSDGWRVSLQAGERDWRLEVPRSQKRFTE